MAKKITELFKEAVAKSQTEEGRRELREERERLEAEALQTAQEAARARQTSPEAPEAASVGPTTARARSRSWTITERHAG